MFGITFINLGSSLNRFKRHGSSLGILSYPNQLVLLYSQCIYIMYHRVINMYHHVIQLLIIIVSKNMIQTLHILSLYSSSLFNFWSRYSSLLGLRLVAQTSTVPCQVPDKFASQLAMEQLTCSGVFEVGSGGVLNAY